MENTEHNFDHFTESHCDSDHFEGGEGDEQPIPIEKTSYAILPGETEDQLDVSRNTINSPGVKGENQIQDDQLEFNKERVKHSSSMVVESNVMKKGSVVPMEDETSDTESVDS